MAATGDDSEDGRIGGALHDTGVVNESNDCKLDCSQRFQLNNSINSYCHSLLWFLLSPYLTSRTYYHCCRTIRRSSWIGCCCRVVCW